MTVQSDPAGIDATACAERKDIAGLWFGSVYLGLVQIVSVLVSEQHPCQAVRADPWAEGPDILPSLLKPATSATLSLTPKKTEKKSATNPLHFSTDAF